MNLSLSKKSIFSTLVRITFIFILGGDFTFSASGTIYESESNDTRTTADRTYDDYDNFGSLSSTSDVDWWKYVATYTGNANIWLGSIPTGCNYDIYMYTSDGTYIACSVQISSSQEIIKSRVVSGKTYYVKVITTNNRTSANYKLRIKNNPLGYARLFVYDAGTIDTKGSATGSIQHIWNMGYEGDWFLNNGYIPVGDTFDKSEIVLIDTHGYPGQVELITESGTKHILAAVKSTKSNLGLSQYDDLSGVKLAIFSSCESGLTDSLHGNLIEMSRTKGAVCAIGWTTTIHVTPCVAWNSEFFRQCTLNKNVANAMSGADAVVYNNYPTHYSHITSRYSGTSRTASVVI